MALNIELPESQRAALNAKAQAKGISTEDYIREVIARDLESSPDHLPIWEVIAGNMSRVPHEDLAELPKDGASQIDHYIYGVPKRAS